MNFRLRPLTPREMVLTTRIAVPLVLILLGAAVTGLLLRTGPTVQMDDHAQRSRPVLVFEARRVPVQRPWRGFGTVHAEEAADVPSRVTATVLEVPDAIEPGVAVEKGQLLVRLDPSDFERRVEAAQQSLAQIEAQLRQLEVERERLAERLVLEQRGVELAEAELGRVREVFESGAANRQDLDRAERALIAAKRSRSQTGEALDLIGPRRAQLEARQAAERSALRLASQDLERSTIESPITGVLQAVDVDRGERVTAGERVARVIAPSVIEIPIQLPAAARRSVAVGSRAMVQPTDGVTQACLATVSRIGPANDAATRTMTAYITLDQTRLSEGLRIAPGTFVTASVTGEQRQPRWVVPRRSVRSGRVLLVEDGVVHSKPVTVAFALEGPIPALGLPDQQWAVLEDFPGTNGQLVVVNASQSVMDGQRVQPRLAGEVMADVGRLKAQGKAAAARQTDPAHPTSAISLPPSAPGGGP